jgi:hypothetical protein
MFSADIFRPQEMRAPEEQENPRRHEFPNKGDKSIATIKGDSQFVKLSKANILTSRRGKATRARMR